MASGLGAGRRDPAGASRRSTPTPPRPIEALEGAQAHVEDAVDRLRALRDRAVFDPERLEQIDARLDAIGSSSASTATGCRRPSRRTGQEIARALDRIERHDAMAEEIEREVEAAAAAAAAEAARCSPKRATGRRSGSSA